MISVILQTLLKFRFQACKVFRFPASAASFIAPPTHSLPTSAQSLRSLGLDPRGEFKGKNVCRRKERVFSLTERHQRARWNESEDF